MTNNQHPEPVTIQAHCTTTPAREIPLMMLLDVEDVLRAHGLDVQTEEHAEVLLALGRILDAVPVERGGRRES
jgi:hypothetical protein